MSDGKTQLQAVPTVDLDAYFARIGYRGPAVPTLATLRALHELHPAAIPFEAMDVLLGLGIDLDPVKIDAKLVAAKRGGYCHEHNSLLKRVLTALGFKAENVTARMQWMIPAEVPRPRAHAALRVTVEGEPWLVDVGFGGCVPTTPLRLSTDAPQETRHERYRFIPGGDGHLLEIERGGEWLPVYELLEAPQLEPDLAVMNWFTATHPNSPFKRILMIARTTPEARYGLMNNRLTVRGADGRTEQRTLDADGIERALVDLFTLPVDPSWRALLERFAQA